jgi:hypothetical protein
MKLLQAIQKAKALLSQVKLTQEPLVDGSLIQYDTPEIEPGEVVYLCEGSNDWSVLPDGKYQTKKNLKFVITDGIVTDVDKSNEIKEAPKTGPIPQAIDQATTKTGEEDNPGKSDTNPKVDPEESTKGKGSEDLTEDTYGDVEYADPGYQKDKKKRYPIDTEEHIRAAWSYINKEKNGKAYSSDELGKIKDKIVAAWKKKIDKDGPPSAQKDASDDVNLSVINPPGAGAPDSLINPQDINADDSYATCMSKLNELHAQHNHLQGAHDKLRSEHDATNAKVNELVDKFNDMMSKNSATQTSLSKALDQIAVLSKQPSAAPIEEIKNSVSIPNDIQNSKAYKIFNSK